MITVLTDWATCFVIGQSDTRSQGLNPRSDKNVERCIRLQPHVGREVTRADWDGNAVAGAATSRLAVARALPLAIVAARQSALSLLRRAHNSTADVDVSALKVASSVLGTSQGSQVSAQVSVPCPSPCGTARLLGHVAAKFTLRASCAGSCFGPGALSRGYQGLRLKTGAAWL